MGVSFDGDHDFGGRRVLEDDHLELRFGRSPRASTTLPAPHDSDSTRLAAHAAVSSRFLGHLEHTPAGEWDF